MTTGTGAYIPGLVACGITLVTGVPDSALAPMLEELAGGYPGGAYLPATREDNAVGLAVGAWLAGATPLVFMKSMGIGTAIDALTSLAQVYAVPLVLHVAWHGFAGRDVPHHNVLGEVLEPVLTGLRIPLVQRALGGGPAFTEALGETLERAQEVAGPAALLAIPPHLHTGGIDGA